MSHDNENQNGSDFDLTAEATEPKSPDTDTDTNRLDAIRNFPEWLDVQLEQIVETYDEFSTHSSRRGYFGRKGK